MTFYQNISSDINLEMLEIKWREGGAWKVMWIKGNRHIFKKRKSFFYKKSVFNFIILSH